jgi:hypothetical protein
MRPGGSLARDRGKVGEKTRAGGMGLREAAKQRRMLAQKLNISMNLSIFQQNIHFSIEILPPPGLLWAAMNLRV